MKEIQMAISERLYARLNKKAKEEGVSVMKFLAQLVAAKVKEDNHAK